MTFDKALRDFAAWADAQSPEFGARVREVIATEYGRQFGSAAPINPAVSTVNKLGDIIGTLSGTYLKSAEAYYTAKGKIADLKLLARGSPATQAVNTVNDAISIPPQNLLLIGGAAVLALILFSRR